MFEFFVFSAGGLVLWPVDAEESRKTLPVIRKYIQKTLLEGKKGDEMFVHEKTAAYTIHDASHDLYFSVTVHSQIARQISYLKQMLEDISKKFLKQYEVPLDSKATLFLPSKFSIDDIVDKFRGSIGQKTTAPIAIDAVDIDTGAPIAAPPRGKSVSAKPAKERSTSPPKKPIRERYTDKRDNDDMQQYSTVVKMETKEDETIEIEQVDLDEFASYAPAPKSGGFLGTMFKGFTDGKVLTEENMKPVLDAFEQHLINKNVASHIAKSLVTSVAKKLEGTKCGTFSSVKVVVMNAFREAIERILTPHRSIDLVRDVQIARNKGKPYVLSFVGVNGIGKTTSLSKVAYLLKSHGFKILVTACDTFRSGAIDQLQQHCNRLGIELFSRGGNRRDPTPVAKDSIKYAEDNGFDVVLIDTAGRMQNAEGLMRQIARLINEVKPDLTLFVAGALVGNNGADQIKVFDSALRRYVCADPRGIDGILLTMFDTIDDKVGAALTLVYETGHPIVYLGIGQHYKDLRRMNPEPVVNSLLDGF